ncbi:hypothetical protein ACFPM7_23265 [Actinokineospora guangxiensis]|uniref:Ig-like domain-containing protein n=1 Tax=Actinokineospora guangxiensis TaxID=1490288 RepID=A0ABW0EVP7_9PSEU
MFRRIGALTALVMVAGAVPAAASNPAGVADAGSASYTRNGSDIAIAPLAPCAVEGPTTASAGLQTGSGVKFTSATSSCETTVLDPDADTTKTVSKASGTGFELSALVLEGGPRIRIANWQVTCTATDQGTNVGWSFSGMSGLAALPNPVPQNYVREIKKSNGTLLATATFNGIRFPSPNDGSIAMTLLRIEFAPDSDLAGEVVLGDTACSPTP